MIHLLRALLSLAGNGRPDDLTAVMDATRETTEPDRTYQQLRTEMVRTAAYDQLGDYGDEHFAEWDRELLWKDTP